MTDSPTPTDVRAFRKKPVVVEAWRFMGELRVGVPEWLINYRHDGKRVVAVVRDSKLLIPTLEGVMVADEGDWIIQGVKGELYPCKPDIFAATYEPAALSLKEPAGHE